MTGENSLRFDMKWIALVALVLQNSGLAIVMRLSILYSSPDTRYFASTAVLNAEIIKFIISSFCCFYFDSNGSLTNFLSLLKVELTHNTFDWVKLTVPSLLYTLQNSLQYISMELLSAPVFQVLYQMKIVTTALFSVIILSKKIGINQWISVVTLAAGVALVQLSQLKNNGSEKSNSFTGLVSVLLGCLTSGFAGVYFEMVLKSSKASIWLRNIQLSVIGGTLSVIACYMRDGEAIITKGYFYGYDRYVWSAILLQAVGGMIVAVVVKYADNIMKGFATSISIILSCLASSLILKDVDFNNAFFIGGIIVLGSVFLYGYTPSNPSYQFNSPSKV